MTVSSDKTFDEKIVYKDKWRNPKRTYALTLRPKLSERLARKIITFGDQYNDMFDTKSSGRMPFTTR